MLDDEISSQRNIDKGGQSNSPSQFADTESVRSFATETLESFRDDYKNSVDQTEATGLAGGRQKRDVKAQLHGDGACCNGCIIF